MKRVRDTRPSNHHIHAESRGGNRRGNLVVIPTQFHRDWHAIFGTLTVEEAHTFIDILMRPGRKWTYEDIDQLRRFVSHEPREP